MNRLFQVFIVVGGVGLVAVAGGEEPLTELRTLDIKTPESVLVFPAQQEAASDKTEPAVEDASSLQADFPVPMTTATADDTHVEAPLPSVRVAMSGPKLSSANPGVSDSQTGETAQQPSGSTLSTVNDVISKLNAGQTEASQPARNSETEQRMTKVRRVLDVYRPKMLNTRTHGPWETMHAIIAYGVDTKIRQDSPYGEPVTAIGWLAYNRPAAGQRLFYARREGGLGAMTGPGLQGHAGQFLAIVAQSHLKPTYPIHADGKEFTLQDLIEYEKLTCKPRSELTFKLIALSHYLDSDASWKSEDGEEWDIQRLIREELAQPINGVACGGTHRLFGLSHAVYQRAKQGKPIVGEFARSKKFISDYQKYTYALQNSDGSFSTEWFKGREARQDLDRRLQTTGHILEWMIFSSPAEDLEDPRLTKAVDYLAYIMLANQSHDWAIGPRGHAIHAMALYDMRMTHLLKNQNESLITERENQSELESTTEGSGAESESVTITLDTPLSSGAASAIAK